MKCPNCNAKAAKDARFCLSCGIPFGAPLPVMGGALCSACGSPVAPGAAFCASCGTPVAARPAPAVRQEFCKACGAPLIGGAAFCKECGAPTAPAAVPVAGAEGTPSAEQILESAAIPVAVAVEEADVETVLEKAVPQEPVQTVPAESETDYFVEKSPTVPPEGAPEIKQTETAVVAEAPAQSCPVCGSALVPGKKFCGACGAPATVAAMPVYAAPPAAPAYAEPAAVPAPYMTQPAAAPAAKKKRKRVWLVPVLIVIALLLSGGGYFIANSVMRKNKYQDAVNLYNQMNFTSALELFEDLGEYEDASTYASMCVQNIDYDKAISLFEDEKYTEAMEIFGRLGSFKDSADRYSECSDKVNYNNAVELFDQGDFYQAYLAFTELGDFEDSASRAAACIQPTPKTGELYHNPNYVSSDATFVVSNDNTYRYYKMYNYETDEHVCTFFVRPYESSSVDLPAGNYRINAAYGYEWFGENDMFGDDGYYGAVLFDSAGTNYYYFGVDRIITLSFDGSGETPIDSDSVGRDNF